MLKAVLMERPYLRTTRGILASRFFGGPAATRLQRGGKVVFSADWNDGKSSIENPADLR
jgi:hypothetical protein